MVDSSDLSLGRILTSVCLTRTKHHPEACVVLGVKQVPIDSLLSDRSYIFFSHTIKAQAENMPLLRACLEKNIRLFDYECIREVSRHTEVNI